MHAVDDDVTYRNAMFGWGLSMGELQTTSGSFDGVTDVHADTPYARGYRAARRVTVRTAAGAVVVGVALEDALDVVSRVDGAYVDGLPS